jgi:tripartite-type tricarboxylate transporter receptor subunit TctC
LWWKYLQRWQLHRRRPCRRSAPDGYTIGIGQWGTNVASGAIYPLNFDLVKDFEPVGLISTQPFLIVAQTSRGKPQDLVAWLKANQDKASQAPGRHA